jgi:hypothetical protein
MSLHISQRNEARLTEEAQRQGLSVDALLERLMNERAAEVPAPDSPARLFSPRCKLPLIGMLTSRLNASPCPCGMFRSDGVFARHHDFVGRPQAEAGAEGYGVLFRRGPSVSFTSAS